MPVKTGEDGDGGFSRECDECRGGGGEEGAGRGGGFVESFPACIFKIFFIVEISLRTPIPLFRSGSVHSGSAS